MLYLPDVTALARHPEKGAAPYLGNFVSPLLAHRVVRGNAAL
jgi:hypothetical protein